MFLIDKGTLFFYPLTFCISILTSLSFAASQELIILDTSTSLQLTAGDNKFKLIEGDLEVEGELSGGEKSECEDYGRSSLASGKMKVEEISAGLDELLIRFSGATYTNGAHFRTCGKCVFGKCVVISGNDRMAEALGTASVTIKTDFDGRIGGPNYLRIASDKLANKVDVDLSPPGSLVESLSSAEEKVYLLDRDTIVNLTYRKHSENEGGCCKSADPPEDITLRVSSERAPIFHSIFQSGQAGPYIRNGKQTDGYGNVGIILIDGKTHCTGVLISKRTVLTAGHCVAGTDKAVEQKRVSFALGASTAKINEEIRIIGEKYHPELSYSDGVYEDDVGLFYLDSEASVTPATLHSGQPNWDLVKSKSLTFVGFGLNPTDGGTGPAGIKRYGVWSVDSVNNRTVWWTAGKREPSTCNADSGGPAFLDEGEEFLLVAITSSGLDTCDGGINMRVDYYYQWIQENKIG